MADRDHDDTILSQAEAIKAQRRQAEKDAELAYLQDYFNAIGATLSGDKDYEVGKVVRMPEIGGGSSFRLSVSRRSDPKERYVCRMRVPAGNSSNLNVMLACGRRDDTKETDEWLVIKHEVDVDAPISAAKVPEKPLLFVEKRSDQEHLGGVFENQRLFTPRQLAFLRLLEPWSIRSLVDYYTAEEVVQETWEDAEKKAKKPLDFMVTREVRTVYSYRNN